MGDIIEKCVALLKKVKIVNVTPTKALDVAAKM